MTKNPFKTRTSLNRAQLKHVVAGTTIVDDLIMPDQDSSDNRTLQCCKEHTYECGGCGKTGCGVGYYAVYCGSRSGY
ncbi:hypothetical protein BAX95_01980 [Elizabethkingia meningoseptica]|uniref:hypothetical protein n=1 Tax=Elizabethkingia meningoseptica TaxID=238 RepID=UPI0009CC889D|nr:hypothetical protein [Elizabethkingia meningoseptica]MDE5429759.1 hypothetical protein [Elizabethkingia meningoseptica]OPC25700.1 hypothetical protein BAX95_01980 [Elizabethkingia meningoseptica]